MSNSSTDEKQEPLSELEIIDIGETANGGTGTLEDFYVEFARAIERRHNIIEKTK